MVNKERVKELIAKLEETEAQLYKELRDEQESVVCDFSNEKITLWNYIKRGSLAILLTAPVIYSMIIPAVIMDIFVTVYQAVCFPVYGIPKVKRSDYIVIDRHRLPYLNILQKINCVYCGYFNGLIDYVQEIAVRTQQYWCPIRHSRRVKGVPTRYWSFIPFGDGKNLNQRWHKLREKLHNEKE